MIKQVLEERLSGIVYDPDETQQLTEDLVKELREAINSIQFSFLFELPKQWTWLVIN
jgi:hypothetical protein